MKSAIDVDYVIEFLHFDEHRFLPGQIQFCTTVPEDFFHGLK